MKIQMLSEVRSHRITAIVAATMLLTGLVNAMPAAANDYDYPIDDPVDCQLYGGWDYSHGVYCEEDYDWTTNNEAYAEELIESVDTSASPTPQPSPPPEPSPTPSETPRDKPGKGPRK